MTRFYADLSFAELIALTRRVTSPAALAPALPPLPADKAREVEDAARIATTHNPEDDK
jgi:hypothetical protein